MFINAIKFGKLVYMYQILLNFLQMKTGCVALVLCLNISVDPPDVIKISPCARMECWIGNH
jgi:Raptor N-terminal CASPase like domain